MGQPAVPPTQYPQHTNLIQNMQVPPPPTSSNYQSASNFHQNAPKYSEFLIVSAPVPAIIDEQRDLVEITRVENPAYKTEQHQIQYQQQLQHQQQLQQQQLQQQQ